MRYVVRRDLISEDACAGLSAAANIAVERDHAALNRTWVRRIKVLVTVWIALTVVSTASGVAFGQPLPFTGRAPLMASIGVPPASAHRLVDRALTASQNIAAAVSPNTPPSPPAGSGSLQASRAPTVPLPVIPLTESADFGVIEAPTAVDETRKGEQPGGEFTPASTPPCSNDPQPSNETQSTNEPADDGQSSAKPADESKTEETEKATPKPEGDADDGSEEPKTEGEADDGLDSGGDQPQGDQDDLPQDDQDRAQAGQDRAQTMGEQFAIFNPMAELSEEPFDEVLRIHVAGASPY